MTDQPIMSATSPGQKRLTPEQRELTAIEKLGGKEAIKGRITEMIAVMRNGLTELPELYWNARWLAD